MKGRRTRGFTIIEVIVVLVVMGILLGVVGAYLGSSAKQSRREAAETVAQKVKIKLGSFYSEKNRYPISTAEAVTYLNSPTGGNDTELGTSFNDNSKFQYAPRTNSGVVCTTGNAVQCDRYTITILKNGWGGSSSDVDIVVKS